MTFLSVLQSHFSRYPALDIQDIYKLIHQATLGAEHALKNPSDAQDWLERELAEMGEGILEPIIDPISADGELLRVHLRPYMASGGDPKILLDAFIRTANNFQGSLATLEGNWKIAVQTRFSPASIMDAFFQQMKSSGFPPLHHSATYRKLYRPAYRVVARTYFSYQETGV